MGGEICGSVGALPSEEVWNCLGARIISIFHHLREHPANQLDVVRDRQKK